MKRERVMAMAYFGRKVELDRKRLAMKQWWEAEDEIKRDPLGMKGRSTDVYETETYEHI